AREALELTNTANVTSFSVVGSVITYTLELTNGGNVTLTSPTIVDASPSTCGAIAGPIAPGLSVSCTASHTVTQADIDAGSVTNTANAGAIAPNADVVEAEPAVADTPADQTIALTLAKSVTEPAFDAVGDDLHYSLTVTNGGNTTLTAATIADAAPGSGNYVTDCATVSATLAPAATVSCSATYTVAQSDLDAGAVTNNALGSAHDPAGNPHPSNSAAATSRAVQLATLHLVESAVETSYSNVGDVLQFPITVTNTGNVTFTSTTISDSSPGDGAFSTNCGTVAVALAPGASRGCQSSYTITATDLAADSLTNEASASAVAAGGAGVPAVDAQVSVARVAPTLAMTGTGVATLVLMMLALLLAGVVATSMRRKRVEEGEG
ncbi:MAG: hypothetical protein ABJA11_04130, partial [Pseudolysinimonas sp.]